MVVGAAATPDAIARAVRHSRFDRLQELEARDGFRERFPAAARFFRKGEVGSWREALTPDQVESLVSRHAAVMRRFGYLSAAGAPVF